MNDIHDLLGAYCTDALDADERAAFEQHLATCDQCRSEAADFREVLAALSDAHPVRPPRDLEDEVVALAGGGGSRPGDDAADGDPGASRGLVADRGPGADRGHSAGSRSGTGSRSPLVRGRASAARWMAAAAAGAVLFAGGVALGRSQAPVESTAAAGDMEAVVAVASAQDAHVLPVDIMGTTSRVVMSQEMDKAVFLASDLPMPAKGMCYQVWRVLPDGTMQSAGVATPAADGHIAVVLDGGAQDVSKFMITMEPPGGSAHPSGEMLAEIDT